MFNLEVAHLALLSQLQSVQHNRVLSPHFFLGAELSTFEIHLSQSGRVSQQISKLLTLGSAAPDHLSPAGWAVLVSFILPTMAAGRFGEELF